MGVLNEMSEAEVLNSMMRGYESMMAVLTNRHRSLQIIYSLWHNKDLKVLYYFKRLLERESATKSRIIVDFSGRGGIRCDNERSVSHRGSVRDTDSKTVSKIS